MAAARAVAVGAGSSSCCFQCSLLVLALLLVVDLLLLIGTCLQIRVNNTKRIFK